MEAKFRHQSNKDVECGKVATDLDDIINGASHGNSVADLSL